MSVGSTSRLLLVVAVSAAACAPQGFTRLLAPDAPTDRQEHALVWLGDRALAWGGTRSFDGGASCFGAGTATGEQIDIVGTWAPVSDDGAPPSAGVEWFRLAVWSGEELLVWGGSLGGLETSRLAGGAYSPDADSWSALPEEGAPDLVHDLGGAFVDGRLVVWGGVDPDQLVSVAGGLYAPGDDAWAPMSVDGTPSPRLGHLAVAVGDELLVWGGLAPTDDEGSVWGVVDGTTRSVPRLIGAPLTDGALYRPATDEWRPVAPGGPAWNAYEGPPAVWTGEELIVLPKSGAGARYDPTAGVWTDLTAPSGATTVVWLDAALLVVDDDAPRGSRAALWDPSADEWQTFAAPRVPTEAVWTGAEVLFWSGAAGCAGPGSWTWTPIDP